MNDGFTEYKDLISQIEAMPQMSPPSDFTQKVMGQLADEQSLSIWQLLHRTLAEVRAISWSSFTSEYEQGRKACFYFLIAGLFYFFIGSVLFSSAFYIGHASKAMGFILLQAILVLMAAIALITGGMMIAADIPGTARWAKRAIIAYGILMILSAFLMAAAVKTMLGGLLALAFGMAGIVTGMTLMTVLENRVQGKKGTFTGELHNA